MIIVVVEFGGGGSVTLAGGAIFGELSAGSVSGGVFVEIEG